MNPQYNEGLFSQYDLVEDYERVARLLENAVVKSDEYKLALYQPAPDKPIAIEVEDCDEEILKLVEYLICEHNIQHGLHHDFPLVVHLDTEEEFGYVWYHDVSPDYILLPPNEIFESIINKWYDDEIWQVVVDAVKNGGVAGIGLLGLV